MVGRFINRLIGRKDSSTDAINAYVEGNASADETKLVEQLKRENPALEKDLATQRSLRELLGRIENIEAPRSFAVTQGMVEASERSESGLFRLAEFFAPQRKFALAPAILAGIAALTVALLTIGDIAGVVEQSSLGGDDSGESTAASSAIGVAGAPGQPGNPGATGSSGSSNDSGASSGAPQIELAAKADTDSVFGTFTQSESSRSGSATTAPAATAAPAAPTATVAQAAATSTPAAALAPAFAAEPADPTEIAADTLEIESAGGDSEPSSLSDAAPASEFGTGGGLESTSEDEVVTERGRTQSFDSADADDSASIDEEIVTSGGVGAEAGDGIADGAVSGFALGAGDGALAGAGAGAAEGAGSGAGKGISLPLWQLQIALAALAVAAIGAWAGLRRVRGE